MKHVQPLFLPFFSSSLLLILVSFMFILTNVHSPPLPLSLHHFFFLPSFWNLLRIPSFHFLLSFLVEVAAEDAAEASEKVEYDETHGCFNLWGHTTVHLLPPHTPWNEETWLPLFRVSFHYLQKKLLCFSLLLALLRLLNMVLMMMLVILAWRLNLVA